MILVIFERERDQTLKLVEAVIEAQQSFLFVNDTDYKQNLTSTVHQDYNREGRRELV